MRPYLAVAGNFLKSLGPNNQLTDAVTEMDSLLKQETPMIAALINNRTYKMDERTRQMKETIDTVAVGVAASHKEMETLTQKMDTLGLNKAGQRSFYCH
jgi:hypothetical protein